MRFPFSNDLSTHTHTYTHTQSHTHTHTPTHTHNHTQTHTITHTHTFTHKCTNTTRLTHSEEEKSSRVISLCQIKFLQSVEAFLRVHPNLRPDKHFIFVSSYLYWDSQSEKNWFCKNLISYFNGKESLNESMMH